MIIKKPYAFLIKNFRKIHLIIAILVGISLANTFNIHSFFKSMIDNTTVINVPSNLITIYSYLVAILLVIFGLIMFILMKKKDKPSKFYLFMTIYYVILNIVLFVFSLYLENIGKGSGISLETRRAFNDICNIVLFPQYFFIIFISIRTIGFDIKKFDFGKDLKELEITSTDNEEFEFVLGFDFHKLFIKFKRKMREFRYYFLENAKLFLYGFLIIIIGIVGVISYNLIFGKKEYKETDLITSGNFQITVLNSYMTDFSQNGLVIDDNKYYFVINAKFKNVTSTAQIIPTSDYMIQTGNKNYLATFSKNNYFNDLGDPYNNEQIDPYEEVYRLIVFEIGKDDIQKDYKLRVGSNYVLDKDGNRVINYKYVNLSPELIENITEGETITFDVNKAENSLNLSQSRVGKSYFNLKGYSIDTKFKYHYISCYLENECYDNIGIYTADSTSYNSTLLILDSNLILDESTLYYQYNKSVVDFYKNFILIKYVYNGTEKLLSPNIKNTSEYTEKAIIEVPLSVTLAERIELIINIRDVKYVIKIK